MLGSSLSRHVLVLWCMIPVAIPLCAQQAVVWPALPGDRGAMNVSLIGTVQVEPPWDPAGDWFSRRRTSSSMEPAYMGSRNGLLHIVDISDPTNMQHVARLAMPGPALDVRVANGLAVVSVQNDPVNEIGAVMVDVTDPTQPFVSDTWLNETPDLAASFTTSTSKRHGLPERFRSRFRWIDHPRLVRSRSTANVVFPVHRRGIV